MTDNVYAIMNVKNDGTFVIQPGLKGNIEYLIDLLKTKCIEGAELAKSSKHNQSSSSTIPKSTSTVTSNNTTEKRKYKSFNLPVAENTTYIIDTLNNCCENNKSKLNIQRFSLVECEYYFILIRNDSNGALKCDIRCCYQKWSSLPLKRGKFQLSNFYRYLQVQAFIRKQNDLLKNDDFHNENDNDNNDDLAANKMVLPDQLWMFLLSITQAPNFKKLTCFCIHYQL
ncbi:unnamed protein product, partial [Rotaria magnacalcarata]